MMDITSLNCVPRASTTFCTADSTACCRSGVATVAGLIPAALAVLVCTVVTGPLARTASRLRPLEMLVE